MWTATDSSEVEVAPAQSARGGETLVGALAALAELEYRLGAWQTAYVTALERLRAATAAGLEQETMFGLASVAMLEAGMGKADACRSHVDRALELSRQRDDRPVEAAAAEALGRLELGLGRVDEAIAWLRRASHLCDEHPDARSVAVSWPEDLADACIRRGDRVGARHAVNRLEQCVDRSGGCALAAAWARSRALVASDDRYERFFEDALAWSARAQQPFDTARTQLCFGERLRRMHRRRDARAQLCAAIETFDALGAQPWAERARHELAGSVVRARRRGAATRDDLTATERRVAQIVADGATNHETASRLFVSAKTVETHLTHIYRKLGLRSRTELARTVQLAARETSGP